MTLKFISDRKIQFINWDNIITLTLEPYQETTYKAPSDTHCIVSALTLNPDENLILLENVPVEEGIEFMDAIEEAIKAEREIYDYRLQAKRK